MQAPSKPGGLTVGSVAATSLQISWSPSSDNVGVTGYGIYVGTTRIGSVSGTGVTISGFSCGTAYTIGVDATDLAGNRSAIATVVVTTAACAGAIDSVPPTAPGALVLVATTRTTIGVRWAASTDAGGIVRYRVWRSSTQVGSTSGTTWSFTGLSCGRTYTLGIEALDTAGNVSARTTGRFTTARCF